MPIAYFGLKHMNVILLLSRDIKLNSSSNYIPQRAVFKFLAFIASLSIVLSVVIYFREEEIKDQINFIKVLVWQLVIWCPWMLMYYFSPKVWARVKTVNYGSSIYYCFGLTWVFLHFTWFFFISSNYSPYLGMPATGYGVYPYFFIFWTLIDIIIVGIILYSETQEYSSKRSSTPTIIELTRREEKLFCEPQEIHWLSSDNYYTHLETKHGKFVMRQTLKYYKEQLRSDEFIQIHRSTIVNIRFVKGLSKDNNKLYVMLKDGSKKSVSKKNVVMVRSLFKSQLA